MKVLISARDPAAAYSLFPVIATMRSDSRFNIHIIAMEPAYSIFRSNGFSVCAVLHNDQESVARFAKKTLNQLSPDALLVGASGPDVGIDEMLVFCSQDRNIATYVLQDFWGDMNMQLGIFASTYFVLDGLAAQLTIKRNHAVRTVEVGAVRYYNTCVDLKQRRYVRNMLCQDEQRLIVFFGQPLWFIKGYQQTVCEIMAQLRALYPYDVILYQPHPKEKLQQSKQYNAFLQVFSWVQRAPANNIASAELLLACDVSLSCFSSIGIDHAVLNQVSPEPLGIPVYALFNSELFSWYQQYSRLAYLPAVSRNMAMFIGDKKDIKKVVDQALAMHVRNCYWRKSQVFFSEPLDGIRKILDTIWYDAQ